MLWVSRGQLRSGVKRGKTHSVFSFQSVFVKKKQPTGPHCALNRMCSLRQVLHRLQESLSDADTFISLLHIMAHMMWMFHMDGKFHGCQICLTSCLFWGERWVRWGESDVHAFWLHVTLVVCIIITPFFFHAIQGVPMQFKGHMGFPGCLLPPNKPKPDPHSFSKAVDQVPSVRILEQECQI